MKRVVVQYKVKPDHAERNAELIRAVFEELDRTQPDGLRYAALRLADGVTFIHITEEPEDGQSPLATLESAERFRAGIAERFAEPAAVQESSEVGSFRLFTSSSPTTETRP
jgi:hypothetical protein